MLRRDSPFKSSIILVLDVVRAISSLGSSFILLQEGVASRSSERGCRSEVWGKWIGYNLPLWFHSRPDQEPAVTDFLDLPFFLRGRIGAFERSCPNLFKAEVWYTPIGVRGFSKLAISYVVGDLFDRIT
ncbi:hypothetical protein AVEN_204100-1 [Araneus ventricosus]|uniref:Uncharacterized protein n=1 Tax=Araneus ventricosus TaxID=182803 RepID=A0A4Y2NSW2_ARAVE|nr:hypothetical protein AVEN_204100-1 [Araneus ventricosus]